LIVYKGKVKFNPHHVNLLAKHSALADREMYPKRVSCIRILFGISTCIFLCVCVCVFPCRMRTCNKGLILSSWREFLQDVYKQHSGTWQKENNDRYVTTYIFSELKWLLRFQRGIYKMMTDNKLFVLQLIILASFQFKLRPLHSK